MTKDAPDSTKAAKCHAHATHALATKNHEQHAQTLPRKGHKNTTRLHFIFPESRLDSPETPKPNKTSEHRVPYLAQSRQVGGQLELWTSVKLAAHQPTCPGFPLRLVENPPFQPSWTFQQENRSSPRRPARSQCTQRDVRTSTESATLAACRDSLCAFIDFPKQYRRRMNFRNALVYRYRASVEMF